MVSVLSCLIFSVIGLLAKVHGFPECIDIQMFIDHYNKDKAILEAYGIYVQLNPSYVFANGGSEIIEEKLLHYTNHPEAFSMTDRKSDTIENENAFVLKFVENTNSASEIRRYFSSSHSANLTLSCHIGTSEKELYWPGMGYDHKWAALDKPSTIANNMPPNAVASHPFTCHKSKKTDYYRIGLTTYAGRNHYVYIIPGTYWLSIFDSKMSRIVRITRPGRNTKILVSKQSKDFAWFSVKKRSTNSLQSHGIDVLDWTLNREKLASLFSVNVVLPVIYKCRFPNETALLMEDQMHFCPNQDYAVLVTKLN